jgi:protein O-GlcNAc transferase
MASEQQPRQEQIDQARQHFTAGRLDEARAVCEALLRDVPDDPDANNLLGVIALSQNRVDEAIGCLRAAIKTRPDAAEFHNNLGEGLRRSGDSVAAIDSLRRAIALRPAYPQAFHNLALAHLDRNELAEAADAARRATELDPRYARAFAALGKALVELQRFDDAGVAFSRALELKPDHRAAQSGLAIVLRAQGRFDRAAEIFHRLAIADPRDVLSRAMLAECLFDLRHLDDAEAAFRSALAIAPDDAQLSRRLARVLETQGRADDAAAHLSTAAAQTASRGVPDPLVRLLAATRLPVVYDSADDVRRWRDRLVEGLAQLKRDGVRVPIEHEAVPPLFYLPYQGLDDVQVQRDFASLLAPPSDAPLDPLPQPPTQRRIRVGFISENFRFHTIGQVNRGLIAQLSRERFEVIVLSPREPAADDVYAKFIARHADRWITLSYDLPAARCAVLEEKLDILFYTDLGMDDFTHTLAFSRLAPHQAVTWGHPCTSGVPAIADYVSAALFESDQADAHYTERLVPLDHVPTYYYRPALDAPPAKSLTEFGFAADDHVYACLQVLFKIHPDFDPILDEILRRDPRGIIVFPQGASRHWEQRLRARLARTMPRTHERVRFIPTMKYEQYLRFTAACAAMLAPIHFGAGNTSYEAFAFGTPTVTLPSPYLKGRITHGLYRAMSVLDCVADSPQRYADLAVKLGTDGEFSRSVRAKILAANEVLYENPRGVRDLETYFSLAAANSHG